MFINTTKWLTPPCKSISSPAWHTQSACKLHESFKSELRGYKVPWDHEDPTFTGSPHPASLLEVGEQHRLLQVRDPLHAGGNPASSRHVLELHCHDVSSCAYENLTPSELSSWAPPTRTICMHPRVFRLSSASWSTTKLSFLWSFSSRSHACVWNCSLSLSVFHLPSFPAQSSSVGIYTTVRQKQWYDDSVTAADDYWFAGAGVILICPLLAPWTLLHLEMWLAQCL